MSQRTSLPSNVRFRPAPSGVLFEACCSAMSLFVFAPCVTDFVRRTRSEERAQPGLALAGGVLAAALLLVSGPLALALVPGAAGGNLTLLAAALAILSLASLVQFPAPLLILPGRMLALGWSIASGIALARGTARGAVSAHQAPLGAPGP
ncbi:MAG: hypothetical protein ACRDI2_02725 [Chloroflexota bacterium]